jgi:ribose-phosphate pyrophosphokinase
MDSSEPANLGILACPGGEQFAAKVIRHLKGIYKRRFDRKVMALSKRYELPKETVARDIRYYGDVADSSGSSTEEPETYRLPELRLEARYTCFANGEIKTEILSPVRGKDVYVVQDVENRQPVLFYGLDAPRQLSVNDHIFNLLTAADAALQAGARRVSLVLPVYPYSRQHKKKGREGLTASRFGQIMEHLGVSRIITLDIHSREIENCFNHLRLENLHASYQIIQQLARITDIGGPDFVVVSPDTGAVDRNKFFASTLKRPLALIYKERDYSKVSKDASDSNITEMKLLGDVRGKVVFMADDMLGTGGTLIKAMHFLREQGAREVICAVSLPFFSGNAEEDFEKAYRQGLFTRIIGTNAVYHDALLQREWYVSADVTSLFAHIISRLHHNRSLSPLLDSRDIIQRLMAKR